MNAIAADLRDMDKPSSTLPKEVLVVDDDPRARKLMQLVLQHAGYQVSTAADAQIAQQMLATYSPDLIVADLMMPGLNGIELLSWVQQAMSDRLPKLVLLTAMDTSETRQAASEAGIEHMMTKPIDRADFLARLARLMERTNEE